MAEAKTQKKDGTLRIKGADGGTVEIRAGRWYQQPKTRPERLMLDSTLSADARRVLDCLELHSIAYGQEACFVQEAGKKRRDLTPADVSTETGLTKQRVCRGMAELEHAGAAARRSVDGGSLRKGKVRLVCFAEPREHPPEDGAGKRERPLWPDWFPRGCEPLKSYITQQKISLLDNIDEVFEGNARDYFLSELEDAARAYYEAAEVIARKLERVRARPNGRRLQLGRQTRQTAAAADRPPDPADDPTAAAAAAPPPAYQEPRPQEPRPNPPVPGFWGLAGLGPPMPPLQAEEDRHAPPPAAADLEVPADAESVLAAMEPYCGETEAARKLIAGCRKIAPDCTIAEICVFTAVKAREIPRRRKRPIENPVGFLIETVPDFFRGNYKARPIPGIPNPTSPDLENFVQDTIRLAAILRTRRKPGAGQ